MSADTFAPNAITPKAIFPATTPAVELLPKWNLWFEYSRMVSIPSAVMLALYVVIGEYQSYRAANEVSYALAGALIGAALLIAMLYPIASRRGESFLLWCSLSLGIGLGVLYRFVELTAHQQSALIGLLALCCLACATAATRWRPQWKYLRSVTGVLTAGFIIYMVVVPAVTLVVAHFAPTTIRSHELAPLSSAEWLRLHSVSGVVMLLFLAFGASVGSFLNVVVYRLPMGKPLFWPPSACPKCDERIRGIDNIPILSWLRLEGCCRNCQTPISIRYPIVEAVVAAFFVFFFYRELISGGASLPVRQTNLYSGIVWILLYTQWDLVTIYLFHMTLLSCLFSWGMIDLDRLRVPLRAIIASVVVTITLASLFPHLNPINSGTRLPWLPTTLVPLGTAVLGCIAGAVGGYLLVKLAPFSQRAGSSKDLESKDNPEQATERVAAEQPEYPGMRWSNAAASLALFGAAVGWRGVLTTTVIAYLLLRLIHAVQWRLVNQWRPADELPTEAASPPRLLLGLSVFAAALIQLCFWRQLHL